MDVDTVKKQIEVYLDAEKYPAEVRYTTDGTQPDASSPLYKEAIVVKDSAHIVAGIFRDGKLQGKGGRARQACVPTRHQQLEEGANYEMR